MKAEGLPTQGNVKPGEYSYFKLYNNKAYASIIIRSLLKQPNQIIWNIEILVVMFVRFMRLCVHAVVVPSCIFQ
jgi:hypothetical protein